MVRYLQRLVIRNIVSPYGLAAISYCVFLFAWLFPPGLYMDYMHETDLIFLDPLTFVFYTGCVGAFLLGVRAVRLFCAKAEPADKVSVGMPLFYLAAPLVFSSIACAIYLSLLGAKLNVVSLLASQRGAAIKAAGQAGQMDFGKWDLSLMFLIGTLWWSIFRFRQLQMRHPERFIFYLFFLPALLVAILTCVATVDRTNLMLLCAGMCTSYLYSKTRGQNVKIVRLALIGGVAASGGTIFFLAFSFLRGALTGKLLLTSLIGYTVASYNRLAALVGGTMHYSYEGQGVYMFRILLQYGRFSDLQKHFGWPTTMGLWQSEFSGVMSAGLAPGFNWSSTFGYLFSDLGWLSCAYMLASGMLAGYVWARFQAGKALSTILYPWIAFWILFWFGWNTLFDMRIMGIVEIAAALAVYDAVLVSRTRTTGDVRVPRNYQGPSVRTFGEDPLVALGPGNADN
jgi:hypothetical protein